MQRVITVTSEEETSQVARAVAACVRSGDRIGLQGDLGAGKTWWTAAFVRALGVPETVHVCSPTFSIVHEYRGGRVSVFHMDWYRVDDPEELDLLGVWDYFDEEGVCVVEWFDRFPHDWPADSLCIAMRLQEGTRRTLVCRAQGDRHEALLDAACARLAEGHIEIL